MFSLSYTVFHSAPSCLRNLTGFVVGQHMPFSAQEYAEWAGINANDIDPADVHAIQDAQSQLGKDFWLVVSHERGE